MNVVEKSDSLKKIREIATFAINFILALLIHMFQCVYVVCTENDKICKSIWDQMHFYYNGIPICICQISIDGIICTPNLVTFTWTDFL